MYAATSVILILKGFKMASNRRSREARLLEPLLARRPNELPDNALGPTINDIYQAIAAHKAGHDHDWIYFTKDEITNMWLGAYNPNILIPAIPGDGILFDGNVVKIDTSRDYSWLGDHTFAGEIIGSNLKSSNNGSGALTYTASGGHTFVGPNDGWNRITDTWTYASATTITVPSGAAAIYKVGQGIKLTQTDVKYFYIVGVADTVLTITGGSDYTLTNAGISAVSYTNTPGTAIGFPRSFNYTPTFTGFSTNPTWWISQFAVSGTLCTFTFMLNATGTSNSTSFEVKLPIPTAIPGLAIINYAADNGILINGSQEGSADGANLALYTNRGGGIWTASGAKGASFQVIYEI